MKNNNINDTRDTHLRGCVRLAKFLSYNGVASRRAAERLIESGAVTVNGDVITTPVFFVDGTEEIKVNGKAVDSRPGSPLRFARGDDFYLHRLRDDFMNRGNDSVVVYAFHKPINTITSTSDPAGRKTIYDIIQQSPVPNPQSLRYIGRLDYKTTGLLLLTNDGSIARQLTLPSSNVPRVYIAKLQPKKLFDIKNAAARAAMKMFLSPLSADDAVFDPARRGMTVDKIKYAPMEIELMSRYPIAARLTLRTGKKNEIRIVMDALGFMVVKLHRVSYGPIELGKLPVGSICELSQKEIDLLRKSF